MATRPDSESALRAENARLRERIAELEGSETELLRAVLEGSPDYICRIDREYRLQYVNHLPLGFVMEGVLGQVITQFIDPSHRDLALEAVEAVFEKREIREFELIGSGPNNLPVRYSVRAGPLFDDNGEVPGAVLLARDVTLQRNLVDTLRARESQLRVAIEATGFGLWSYEIQPDQIAWHREVADLFGLSPEEAPKNLSELWPLIHPDDRKRVDDLVVEVIERGEPGELEFRIYQDGNVRWLFARVAVERDSGGAPMRLIGGMIDITEPKQLAEQLRQSQKMDALGQLATGIAHNFNNLLTSVGASLAMLRRRADESAMDFIDTATMAANRGAELVRQLMLFSRAELGTLESGVDVAQILQETISMCSATFDKGIEIQQSIGDDLSTIRGDATQLGQVFLNICLNGRDSMSCSETRRLSVSIGLTSAEELDFSSAELKSQEALSEQYLKVEIRDTGSGMNADTMSRAFEPFFTTKEIGKGTGLGLSTSYAIVRRHGGWVRCQSAPGDGTTFQIYLPVDAS